MAKNKTLSISPEAHQALVDAKQGRKVSFSRLILELAQKPSERPVKATDSALVKLITLVDDGVPKLEIAKTMGSDYIALWHKAVGQEYILIHDVHGPLVTAKGVDYAGLPPE